MQKGKDTVKIYEQQNAICKDCKLERYFVTKEYANKLTGFEVHGGDIIVSCAGTIGEIYEIPYDAEMGIINQALMRIKVYQKVVDKGIFIILFSKLIDKFSIVHSNGSAIKNIPAFSDLKPTIVFVPSIAEQKKIRKCFESIDHLITLHQSKSFGHILKAIVSCTLSWEQRKLGEYLIQYTEVTIINDQYPVLTSSRKGIFFQKDYYDGNQIASENNIGYNIVPYGYFTYRHMSDDEIFYFNINNIIDNGIVSTLYPVFTTNNRLDSKFLQYELNFGKEFRKYSVLQKQGGSRTYMYFNKLRDLKLTITTSLKEQECIRNLICSIDHLITLHQLEPFQLIFKAIAYRIIDYTKSKPPSHRK